MRLLRSIWNIWFWIWMFIMLIPYLPFLFAVLILNRPGINKVFFKLSYFWVPRILFAACFIRMRIHRDARIEDGQSYVIVCNHQSSIDIFASPYLSPVHFKYLSKEEVRKMPVFGPFTSAFCVFVERKSRESRAKSFQAMAELMEKGESILVYPEGTRNRSAKPLTDFYDGAFRLAIQAQKPILVEVLANTGRLNSPKRKLDLSPGVIEGYLLGPVETKGKTDNDIDLIKEEVRNLMLSKIQISGK